MMDYANIVVSLLLATTIFTAYVKLINAIKMDSLIDNAIYSNSIKRNVPYWVSAFISSFKFNKKDIRQKLET
ncbi:hypothetical protein L2748_24075, partial [Shewanella sairae]